MNLSFHTTDIYIYPVKSLGPVKCKEIRLSDYGFKDDRRWMIVDNAGNMVTQREFPKLNVIECFASDNGYSLRNGPDDKDSVEIFSTEEQGHPMNVKIWNTQVQAYKTQVEASEWISQFLGGNYFIVGATPKSRMKKNEYLKKNHELKFQDAYPIHMVNVASVQKLSEWCGIPMSPMQCRPNMILNLSEAFLEDEQEIFVINGLIFEKVKACERCVMMTIKPGEGKINKEPLSTLAKKRKVGNGVIFGVYLIAKK